jgi:hypothetical protein
MNLNIFATKAVADEAQAYDFDCKKSADMIAMDAESWHKYYSVTTCWAVPRKTVLGKWAYEECPQSDKKYSTVPYSVDLFPVVDED